MTPLVFLFILDVLLTVGKWVAAIAAAIYAYSNSSPNIVGAIVGFVLAFLAAKVVIWLIEFLTVPLGYALEQKNGVHGTFTEKFTRTSRWGRQ